MSLHRFTTAVAVASFLLVVAGSLVTGTGWGLPVHRVIGMVVGLLAIVLTVAYLRAEPRAWVRWLAILALNVVVLQGLLGGVNLLSGLPPVLSSTHTGLAAIFFALMVALVVTTSEGWLRGSSESALRGDAVLRRLGVTALILVYLELMLGAVVRHSGAAAAIPDYPLAFGRLLPPVDALAVPPVAVHFAHRICALLVAATIAALVWRIVSRHRDRAELVRPAACLAVLVMMEMLLGAVAVAHADDALRLAALAPDWRSVAVASGLMTTGALILGTTVVLALRMHRPFLAAELRRG